MTARSKRDIAYGCFLFPAAACLSAVMAEVVLPNDGLNDGIAARILYGVLFLSGLASLAAIPLGVIYSIVFWRDGVLPLLSILTILIIGMVGNALAGVDVPGFYGPLYVILVLILEASWFLWRRRAYPT
jgi:hypothetical protein